MSLINSIVALVAKFRSNQTNNQTSNTSKNFEFEAVSVNAIGQRDALAVGLFVGQFVAYPEVTRVFFATAAQAAKLARQSSGNGHLVAVVKNGLIVAIFKNGSQVKGEIILL